jgi:hypothetical protein
VPNWHWRQPGMHPGTPRSLLAGRD